MIKDTKSGVNIVIFIVLRKTHVAIRNYRPAQRPNTDSHVLGESESPSKISKLSVAFIVFNGRA